MMPSNLLRFSLPHGHGLFVFRESLAAFHEVLVPGQEQEDVRATIHLGSGARFGVIESVAEIIAIVSA